MKAGRTTIFITGEIDIGGGSDRPPLLNQTEMKLETVTVFCGDPPPDGGATDAGDGVIVDGGTTDGGASAFAVQTVAKTGDEIMGTNAVVGEIQLHGIDDSGKVTFIHSVDRITNVLEEDDRGLRLAVTESELERVLGPYTFRVIGGPAGDQGR